MTSFFISYNKADKAWAEWIAWVMEEDASHSAVIQAWDFRPGGNFVLDMQRAASATDKTIVVLSDDYLNAEFTHPEWAAAFADDPESLERKIIPIRVKECKPRGLLRPIAYVDLVALEIDAARQALVDSLPERLKPETEPPFPKNNPRQTNQTPPEFPNSSTLAVWNVPYDRNTFFTGRKVVLQTLHEQLNQTTSTASPQIQAISGLGGIGKTQIAVEYAYRHRNDYQAIFWVRAEAELEIHTSFVEIAQLLNLPQQNAQDPEGAIRAVKLWLENHSAWLLILDNADKPENLAQFRPRQGQGHIVLTSRAQTFDNFGIARPISLLKMSASEAVTFLFKRSGREANTITEQEAAKILANELGYLPLALEQASAFILRRKLRFNTYLNQYRKQRLKLLERQLPTMGNEQQIGDASQPLRPVQTTWQLNFDAVQNDNPASAELLKLSAFVAPDIIPYELLIEGRTSFGGLLEQALEAEDTEEARFVIADLLEPLTQYSLIRQEPEQDSYTIHRLVQEVVKAELDEEKCFQWAETVIKAIIQTFSNAEYANWEICKRLLSHAKVAASLANVYQIESKAVAVLLNQTGYYLNQHAQYKDAEQLFRRAITLNRRLFGEEHPDVAQSLNDLAELYYHQGHYSEAEPLYQEALKMRKQLLSEEHPDVATSLNNLAALYKNQGHYSEAEKLYQKALAMRKQLLSEEHPDVANSLNNLATLYYHQGRYSEAESLYQEAIAIQTHSLGEKHPDMATSLNNLAGLYYKQGQYQKAEPLYQDVLELRIQLLGEEHPSVASSLNNLAGLYYKQEQYEKAEPLYNQALTVYKQLLGEEHPFVASSLNNLATFYRKQGRYNKAEPLYQKALGLRKQLLGEEHPDVATSLHNLAALYDNQNRYDEAIPLYQKALELRMQLLGEEHPSVASSLNNLATLYKNQGRYNEAEPLYQRALELRKSLLGEEHPSVATNLNNLATLYKSQGRYGEANTLYKQALIMSQKLLGRDHSSVGRFLDNLAMLYSSQNDFEKAKATHAEALNILEQSLGIEHPWTIRCRENLKSLHNK
ncbi:MAG: tetratricopeptide repeat protein [Cyanobacteria bacterium P01_F01_bin.13]